MAPTAGNVASAPESLLRNVPPHSLDAERAVLGALLIDPRAIDEVAEAVQPPHFYKPAHAAIYEAVLDLWKADQPIDVVLVNEELARKGALESIGGTAALVELTETVPTAANAAYYAEVVRDYACRRQLIQVVAEIQKDAFEDRGLTEELLDRTEKRLFEVTQKRIRSDAVPVSTVVQEAFERLELVRKGGGVVGIPSGLADLDELTQGFQPGEMTILAARPSMGKCLAHDALVLLADGRVATMAELHEAGRAGRVSGGTGRLLTLGDDSRLRPAEPTGFVDDGVKPVFRVTTRLGRRVETTLSHPFLTTRGWRPLAELEPGERIAVPARLPVSGQRPLSEARVRLLAYATGDGQPAGRRSPATRWSPLLESDRLAARAELALDEEREPAPACDGAVPPEVFTLPAEQLALFLNRLFAVAGWLRARAGRVELGWSGRSERLARQVQHLLLRFGVVAGLRAPLGAGERWKLLVVRPGSVSAFLAEVGALGLARAISRASDVLLRTRERGAVVAGRHPQLGVWGSEGAAETSADVARPADETHILWDPIASIEPAGEKQVYDLEVAGTANFVAEDVCVHNTTLALNILRNVSVYHGRAAVFFSLEMPRLQVTTNLLCGLAKIDGHRLRGGYLSREEERQFLDAAEVLMPAQLYIDDTPGLSTMDLRAKARRLKSQHDIDLIMIDYLQLMSGSAISAKESRQQEVSEISRMTKSLARELNIPIIALAQLSRKVEERKDHKPMMSDLRESGCLAGDSLVTLVDGREVPIRDLCGRAGFRVWALHPATERLVPAEVRRAFSTGRKPVFALRTSAGELRATANHRFYGLEGWRRLDELLPGDFLAIPCRAPSLAAAAAPRARSIHSRAPVGGTATISLAPRGEVAWAAIESIEPAGEEEVFDLTVPGPESFLANGLVVHNSIEQDADLVMLLHRPGYYEPEKEEYKNQALLIVAKNRNGPVGEVPLLFFNSQMRFESSAKS